MGVAGEVVQRLEFAEDRDIDRGAKGLFQFVEGGDLAAQQQRTQFIGAERERSHNVIVPVKYTPYIRNYNKLAHPPPLPAQAHESHACKRFMQFGASNREEQRTLVMTDKRLRRNIYFCGSAKK